MSSEIFETTVAELVQFAGTGALSNGSARVGVFLDPAPDREDQPPPYELMGMRPSNTVEDGVLLVLRVPVLDTYRPLRVCMNAADRIVIALEQA